MGPCVIFELRIIRIKCHFAILSILCASHGVCVCTAALSLGIWIRWQVVVRPMRSTSVLGMNENDTQTNEVGRTHHSRGIQK